MRKLIVVCLPTLMRVGHLLAFMLCVGMAAAQPSPRTSYTESVALAGEEQAVDVYRPDIEPPAGVAIIAHGFTRSRARHRDLGRALASAGVIAVIPDLPSVMDLWSNGDAIAELAQKLEAGALGLAPVARSRLVLIGTSAGGLATVLAAAKLPGVAGWIGLDPVDRTGSGSDAASQLTAPAVVMLADPSACNLFASGRSIARAVPHLLRTTLVDGASHCDFEDPTNNMCRALCGASSSAMQTVIRDETVTTAREMLRPAPSRTPDLDVTDAPRATE
jgi:dienelactone hydrolase